MAQQTINIGSTANDGTGDPLRTAFDKINDNFNELYGASPFGQQITIAGNEISSNVSNANLKLTASGTGAIEMEAIQISDNKIQGTRSNEDIAIEPSGTGLVDFKTPTQTTVGAVGAATHLPLDSANEIRPVGYLRVKISGTEYVIPYFNAS